MSFRLWTIFYAFALLAAAMATFGPWGIVVALVVLGFWSYCWKYGYPKIEIWEWVIAVLIAIGCLLCLPAVQSVRGVISPRNQCQNNLKQIALAILNYEITNRSLPPAFVADANGKPMHSWRVLILPFLEETALFKKYNFNEPWDGPNNSKLADQIPEVYRCPSHYDAKHSDSVETSYFVVVGPETAFPGGIGRPFTKVADGTANTIMVIEASGLKRNWMDPHDVTLEEAVELLTTKPQSGHMIMKEGFFTKTYSDASSRNLAFCDGHVVFMGQLKNSQIARAMLTCAGKDLSALDREDQYQEFVDEQEYRQPVFTTVIKWGQIWGLSVFAALSLLPAAWLRRRSVPTHPLNPPAPAATPD